LSKAAPELIVADDFRGRQLAGLDALLALSFPIAATGTVPASLAPPQHRILTLFEDRALRGAFALMLSAVVTGLLSFVFWAATARHHGASAIGTASAEVSAIAFLAVVGGLNLSSIFARFLPVAGWRARRLILISYGGASITGLIGAVIFLMTPLAKGLVVGGRLGQLAFVLCVMLNSIFNIQDGGLIGFGRFELVPIENSLVALLRLALLPLSALVLSVQIGILWSWAVPMAVAVLAVNLLVVGPFAGRQAKQSPNLPPLRRLGRLVAVGSVTTAVYSATGTFLPALVTHQLGAGEGGYFYVPWVIATMIVLLFTNISISMVREAVASPEKANYAIRRSIGLALLVVIVAMACCLLIPRLILAPLGPTFAVQGAPLLRWVGLAVPATALIVLFWAICLVRQHPWPVFMINLTTSAVILAGVLRLGRGAEIDRVGVIYCIVQWGAAAILTIPTLKALRAVRHHAKAL
jgi:O-antigen/teichoic acid export membrane protein